MSQPQTSSDGCNKSPFSASRQSIQDVLGFAPALSSEPCGWKNLGLFCWQGPCPEAALESFDEPVIVYHVGGPQTVPVRLRGHGWDLESRPGRVTIIPPAMCVGWDIQGRVDSRSLHLGSGFFDPAQTSGSHDEAQLRFRCGVHDPLLASTIHALEDELRTPRERGTLYADSAADFLALHLLRTAAVIEPTTRKGVLSKPQLQRVVALIEDSIEHGIGLQALADEAALSRSHFSTAFRRSTGVSPYRYLKLRRLNRAMDLLKTTALSLSDIALRCGFSSQAHFTVHFHREHGTPPGRFRSSK